jgi:galactokinase/mevalonate kinase-like predicted kinase
VTDSIDAASLTGNPTRNGAASHRFARPDLMVTGTPAGSAILTSAPGRCGIIGNPTDMYGGSVLSCSIEPRAYALVEPCDRLTLVSLGKPLVLGGREDFTLRRDVYDISKACLAELHLYDAPIRLTVWSDIPFASGLSSSSALVCATFKALSIYAGKTANRYQFAELSRSIELNRMGVICGYQDFYMTSFGGLNYLDFREKEFYREVGKEPYATVENLNADIDELPFVLAHTGVVHSSGAVHKPIRERWLEGDKEVRDAYLRIGQLAREGKKAILLGDWTLLAALMTENHAIQRDLGGSGPDNEALIALALKHGARSAKLAGAGGGGTIIALHPEPQWLGDKLREEGADRILFPAVVEGVRVEQTAAAKPGARE